MLLVEKCKSTWHRYRTFLFKKSGRWDGHPLNIPVPPTDWQKIDADLTILSSHLPFTMHEFIIDPREYAEFRRRFWPGPFYAFGYKDKKIVEHFVSYHLLALNRHDRYIDVASENSPFPSLYRKILGIRAYSQDISYKPGVCGYQIGSSADNMPVQSASVDKISLHCSFEHFQNDVDIRFMHELKRVLIPGGACGIVPLYLSSRFLNIVDPVLDYSGVRFDEGALVVGETNLGGLFGREYSPESLQRILIPDLGLQYEIFRIRIPSSILEQATPLLARVKYALRIMKR